MSNNPAASAPANAFIPSRIPALPAIRTALAWAMCAVFLSSQIRAQVLLYSFNESGTKAANTGSGGSAYDLLLYDASPKAADLHGSFGGKASPEKALDMTSANGMGRKATESNPGAYNPFAGKVFDGATAFTVCGWYYSPETPDFAARIFQAGNIMLMFDGGRLVLQYGEDTASSGSSVGKNITSVSGTPIKYNLANQAVFFAVTYSYDAAANTKTVIFHQGLPTQGTPLSSYKVVFTPLSSTLRGFTTFVVAGNGVAFGNERPFDGYIDDLAIYTTVLDEKSVSDIFTKTKH